MSDSYQHIDDSAKGASILNGITCELQTLGRAFHITGNTVLSDHLIAIAADIEKANKLMRDALTYEINDRCNSAQKGVAEMFTAVLDHSNNQLEGHLNES